MGYDNDGFDFEDDQEQNQGPKALRDALKAANKRLAELEATNKSLSGKVTERNLKDVLGEKGLRPGLARAIKKDGVDASDPKEIEDWLNDPANQEDYAFSLDAGDDNSSNGQDDEGSEEESEYAAQFARLQNAGTNALPTGRFAEGEAQIKSADSIEGIQAALDKAIKGTPSK